MLLKTTNLVVSKKLQDAGFTVVSITGGIIGDPKTHYFKTTLKKVEKITNAKGEPVLIADELAQLEETDKITPSKRYETGLEEIVKEGTVRNIV